MFLFVPRMYVTLLFSPNSYTVHLRDDKNAAQIFEVFLLNLFRINFYLHSSQHVNMETIGSLWKTVLPLWLLSLFFTVQSSSYLQNQTSSAIRFKLERQITMRAGAPLKVALFSDLHFGEDAWTNWGPLQDVNSIKVMNTVLDDECPGQKVMNMMSVGFMWYYHLQNNDVKLIVWQIL